MAGGSPLSSCDVFEVLVMLFQVCGIMGLCLSRLMPRSTAWSSRGQVGSVVALFGLGIAGALCGRHDSEFALFAGGTMTVLLDWNDDGERVDRTGGTGGTVYDDRAGARRLKTRQNTANAFAFIAKIISGPIGPDFFLLRFDRVRKRAP